MNLGKTASVKSVTTDTKILDAKKIETAELLVDGVSISEVVPKWKPREHIYRCVLEEDDDYIIYDDEGNFLDCKLDKLENGSSLFHYTKGVENFSFSLPSLTNGSNMFSNCNLGEKAVESILRTIPEYSEGSHPLTMNMSPDAFEKFNKITGNYLMEPGTISYKGWEIASNAVVALPDGYRKVEYLEGTGTQYINTGIYPTSESYLNILFASTNASQGVVNVAGARDGYPINMFCIYLYLDFRLRYGSLQSQGIPRNEGQIHSTLLGRYAVVNGSPVDNFKNAPDFTVNSPLWLFGSSEKGGIQCDNLFIGRIYKAELYDSVETSGHFIPALDPTGAPCMFDFVSRKPFYNSGAGDFIYPTESTTYSLRRVLPDWGKLTEHGLRRLYHTPEGYTGELSDYALEHGFKPIIESEMPEEGYYSPRWMETEEEIILEWDDISSAMVEEEMTDV